MSGYRAISERQAMDVLAILKEECGYRQPDDPRGFPRTIRTDDKDGSFNRHVCTEYRFMGALGFGGKFRNNGNQDNTPHVDCYPENMTPARRQMIDRANARLRDLFNERPPNEMSDTTDIVERLRGRAGDYYASRYEFDELLIEAAVEITRLSSSRAEVVEECAMVADDAERAAALMLRDQPAATPDYLRSRGAESTANMIARHIRALSKGKEE